MIRFKEYYFVMVEKVEAAAIRFPDGKQYTATIHPLAVMKAEDEGRSEKELDFKTGYGYIVDGVYYPRDVVENKFGFKASSPGHLDSLDIPELAEQLAKERPEVRDILFGQDSISGK